MWDVQATTEYLDWFKVQDVESKQALATVVILLEEFGPQLKRPHADSLKGSSIGNLKKLRARTRIHVLRVAYCFDEKRSALLLIGGDKKGKNEKKFYKDLIRYAEQLLERYRS